MFQLFCVNLRIETSSKAEFHLLYWVVFFWIYFIVPYFRLLFKKYMEICKSVLSIVMSLATALSLFGFENVDFKLQENVQG